MLPQNLVCKYELNCEYCNIILARNKAPWWWSGVIETCRSVLKCFMWNCMCIRWLINWSDSTKMHGATIRFKVASSWILFFSSSNVLFNLKYSRWQILKLSYRPTYDLVLIHLMYRISGRQRQQHWGFDIEQKTTYTCNAELTHRSKYSLTGRSSKALHVLAV